MSKLQPKQGFLLTRSQYDKQGQCYFELWCKSETGIAQLVTVAQKPVCFATEQNRMLLQQLIGSNKLAVKIESISLTNFDSEPCIACYSQTLREYYLFRKLARQAGVELLEDDIKPVDRFLMERFIQGDMAFIGDENVPVAQHYKRLQQVKVKQSTPEKVRLTAMSVDIECDEKGYLYSIGLYSTDHSCACAKVLYNTEGVIQQAESAQTNIDIEWLPDERALLTRFVDLIQVYDPDCLIGWNFIQFDIRVLVQAGKRINVRLNLGRDGSELEFNDGNRENHRFPDKAYVAGRVILDGIEVMRNATYYFSSFALNNVATEILGEQKLIQESSNLNKLAEIKRQYQYEPLALAAYNLQDCKLVADIFKQERLLEYLQIRSRLTGLELDKVGGSVAAFTNLYLPHVHRKGWVAPNLVAPEDYLHSPGGFVMDSKPGLHNDVLVFDFKSLYPSIMRTFNVDPIALVEAQALPETEVIQGFRGGCFSRTKSILSDILDKLWQAREQAKQENNKVWSNAIKIIMNSFYGVLGSAGCRFYDTKLASSITVRGHWVLQESQKWFEAKGLNVIYGDTDSIFVCLDGSDYKASDGKIFEEELNNWWQIKLRQEFSLSSKLEMEFETHYQPFFMPTIRGSEAGSKKRYAGMKQSDSGGELIFKGLENVRSDWTDLAKEFQKELFLLVFSNQDCRSFLRHTIQALRQGKLDDKLVYYKRIRQPLASYTKTTPPHIKAARLANDISQTSLYKRGTPIRYVIGVKGPEVADMLSAPIDYEHYVAKQLLPIAESILDIYDSDALTEFNTQYSIF